MNAEKLKNLISEDSHINVSIYMPTFRSMPDQEQNPIRYGNLLNEAKDKLEDLDLEVPAGFFDEADKLEDNEVFWNYVEDGFAILITENSTEMFKTAGRLPEKVLVGKELHILPLLNRFEFVDSSYILDISKDQFSLLHMSQNGLDEIETDLETHFDDLYEDKDIESNIQSTDGAATSFHGHKTASQVEEVEEKKYMRYLVNGFESLFNESDDRLIVFGTTESIASFRDAAKTKSFEIDEIIEKPLKSIDNQDLYDVIKENLLPKYIKQIEDELEDLRSYEANNNGSFSPTIIERDAQGGRIRKVYISTDYEDMVAEITDNIINNTIRNGGQVEAINPDHVEFEEEIGAIYRF